jgi:hypothetical protein
MGVLRGGPGDLSLSLPYITRPTSYISLGLYIHCAIFLVDYPLTLSFGGFGRARIRVRLGKSQVQGPITCPLVDGLMICNWDYIYTGVLILVPYILYQYFHKFFISGYLSFHVIHIGVSFQTCIKHYYYLYIFNIVYLKYSIGIWVQSRKEDQILKLDLNPYWVIFKLLTFSRWLWDPDITGAGLSVDESARCSPARWQGCFAAFASELGSWIGSIGFLSLISFFWVFYLRDCCPFRWS